MSFSTEVKNNLARIIPETKEQQISELSGIIRMGGKIRFVGGGLLSFVITIENPAVSRKIVRIVKTCFALNMRISVNKNENLKKRLYTMEVIDRKRGNDILLKTGLIEKDGEYFRLTSSIPPFVLRSEMNSKAYIRGAFIGGGSATDPGKSYHIEFVTGDDEFSGNFKQLLQSLQLRANVTRRKNNNVIYIKDSNDISDLLTLMGDYENTFLIENVKAKKEVRNKVNRMVNCETANLYKVVKSSVQHVESIDYIKNTVGLKALPDELRIVAEARLENRYSSLKELADMLGGSLGRSGVNHRLKKIQALADKLREEDLRSGDGAPSSMKKGTR